MSVTLADSDILDLTTGTLKRLGRLRFNQIATRLQHYEAMQRIMKRDKVQFDDGVGIQRTLMIDHSGAAKNTGLYETDEVSVGDVLKTINVPWRHTTVNYAYERRELLMNAGSSKIVDLLRVRRADAMIAFAEHIEDDFWSAPPDSTDKLQVYGVPYWVPANDTRGFNGGDPYSGVGAGGLLVADAPRWNNYTDSYTEVTKNDLIRSLRYAYRQIRFKSPVDIPDFRRGVGTQYRLYCNLDTITEIEEVGEAQNENLGRDVAEMDGQTVFRRNPIVWVPKLDDDSTNPIYMLNFAYFYPVFLRGDFMRESEPKPAADQHNTWVVHIDLTWQIICTDRRAQAVLRLNQS